MKNKLIYPLYGILIIFLISIAKLAVSKENDYLSSPGTRWLEVDNFVGGSRAVISNDLKPKIIEPVEFAEDISMPNLPDIPLTEEDK
tara:strand:+ start:158 stop:418 length:261 start_codon:yes stop_codon:yes gene_type:complete